MTSKRRRTAAAGTRYVARVGISKEGHPGNALGITGFEFEASRSRALFEHLVEAFMDDYMKKRHSTDDSGWRGLSQLARSLKVAPSTMYGRHGGMSPELGELVRRGLVESRVFRGERGRGGEVTRLRIAYERDPVRDYVKEEVMRASEDETARRVFFPRDRLAILPFVNLGSDAGDEYLADGMTEELITVMSRISGLRVIARTSVSRFKGRSGRVNDIAKELGVGAMVEGSVRKAGERIRVAVQLIDSLSSEHLWAESYDRELTDVLAIQSDISMRVAEALKVRLLPREQAAIEKETEVHPGVHMLYLKGRYYWNERNEAGIRRAIKYFERAIENDPGYALAYVGIADCYNTLVDYENVRTAEGLEKVQWNLRKALELDDNLGEAHAALGFVLMHTWEWSRAESEFKKAIELNPSYAAAHHWYSIFLGYLGRLDEALAEMNRAYELDPLSLIIITATGAVHHYRREYDRAIEWHKKALSMDPDFEPAIFNLVLEYIQASMVEEAKALAPKLESMFRDYVPAKAGWASYHTLLGRIDDARRELKEAESIRSGQYISATDIAQAYIRLGETESAFEWLDTACEEKSAGVLALKVEPAYDPMRSDPRFGVLLGRLGLPV